VPTFRQMLTAKARFRAVALTHCLGSSANEQVHFRNRAMGSSRYWLAALELSGAYRHTRCQVAQQECGFNQPAP